MSFMDDLYVRRKKLADVLADEEYSGIRQIVEDLYPDQAHFIYELLQNAEDAGAKKAKFILEANRLVFEHDGRPFNDDDVAGITNIGKGSKADKKDKIGRFGIGFKAVFAYTETPHIWSPTYSFKISDLVLPSLIPENIKAGLKTRFEFPFNSPKKSAGDAYEEIEIRLNELAETTLLFLSSLESINWQIGTHAAGEVLRIEHAEHHIEVLKRINGKAVSSAHYLCFFDTVKELINQHVAIAFELEFLPNIKSFVNKNPIAGQLKIVSANTGQVAVYFPAEKETSGFRFHLHAPFVPELSRASIKQTPLNAPLLDQIAQLAVSSLYTIRDLKMLTGDFLGVLPNNKDTIPYRYQSIRTAIINEMNNQPLTPTHEKSHAPAKQLLQAKASLKLLLPKEDLEFLLGNDDEPLQWVIGVSQKNSPQDRFLSSLSIDEWDIESFVELLVEKASTGPRWLPDYSKRVEGPDKSFMAWLADKLLEWHQQMYALLYDGAILLPRYKRTRYFEELKPLLIVRLGNGKYNAAKNCFFPSADVENDEVLPRIPKGIYSSGKSKTQQENARKLLEEIGVREVGRVEQVEAILKQRYTYEAKAPELNSHLLDLKRFIKLFNDDQSTAVLFSDYYIFQREDGLWSMPNDVYLDSPFLETGLKTYHEALGEESECSALAKRYEDCGVSKRKIAAFAKASGAQTVLEIEETSCFENPQWNYLCNVSGSRYTSPIDSDFIIPKLKKLFQNPTIEISKLLWRTMCSLPSRKNYLVARYRKNMTNGSRTADSQLVHHLRTYEWVPQTNEDFVSPSDASYEMLPDGFPFDADQEWLKAINFGVSVEQAKEEYTTREKIASSLNVPVEVVDFLSELPDEEREKEHKEIIDYIKHKVLARRQSENIQKQDTPYHKALSTALSMSGRSTPIEKGKADGSSINPARRREKTSEDIGAAIEDQGKFGDQFSFSLSKKWKGKNDQVRVMLAEWYAGQCQICKKTFTQRNGNPFFEGLYLVPHTTAEWLDRVGNVLCLCPWHSAMFQFGPKEVDENIIDQIVNLKVLAEGGNNHLAIRMKLCGEPIEIEFVDNHLIDLQEMIKTSRSS